MKVSCIGIILLLLTSGCFSYKTVPTKEHIYIVGDYYKIKPSDLPYIKGRLEKATDTTINLYTGKNSKEAISITEISQVKKRKFSWLKTLAIPVVTTGIIYSLANSWSLDVGTLNFSY